MKALRTDITTYPPLLVTREEAQHFLRYGETEIAKLLKSGHLKVVGEGRAQRITYSSMIAFVEQNQQFAT